MCPDDASIVVGESEYPTSFAATVAQGSLFATQFHPEKSHRAGLQLLANFARWHPA
jgi:glutamine amidotransferase